MPVLLEIPRRSRNADIGERSIAESRPAYNRPDPEDEPAADSSTYASGSSPGLGPDSAPPPPSSPPGNIPEKLLARLWQKRAARQREFRTGGGRRVKVLYPGRAGSSAGPDFRNALLEVEGLGLVQGDVEIHVRQQDWYAHGHAQDPNYNGVVLHAALEVSPQVTHLQSGRQAPVISLAGLLASADDPEAELNPAEGPAGEGLWAILESRGWGRPADAARLGDLLDAAGDARFQARSAGFGALLAFLPGQPAGQTLYEGLMEALGYRANRQPFLKLAHRAPYALLAREALAYPSAERTGVIEDRLLKLAGLPAEKNIRQRGTIPRAPAGYGSPLAAGEWHCFRVRPANHPRHRIAGAARLIARFLESGLELGLIAGLGGLVSAGNPGKLTSALTVAADPGQRTACVGAARARDMAVNVVLPFFHALACRAPAVAGEADASALAAAGDALKLYRDFGKLQDNELTREMADRLLEPTWKKAVNSARRQQGLIHLHRQLTGAA